MSIKVKINEILSIVDKVQFLQCLSLSEIEYLAAKSTLRNFRKDESIFKFGDTSEKFYLVLQGIVKLSRESHEQKEFVETFVYSGQFFGELTLSDEHVRMQDSSSLTAETTCLEIRKETIFEMIEKNSSLAICVIKLMGKRLEYVQNRASSLVLHDARTRIIDFIKNNVRQFGQQVGLEMLLKHTFTQQDIADFTGTSRQTVTTVLNELRKTNKIQFRRKTILIRDLSSL
jgi:CRP/FNR family transcriptional regulator, cyclic AMP receptor protein